MLYSVEKKYDDFEFIGSWDHENVFLEQLNLNLKELDGNYPYHWNSLTLFLKQILKLNKNTNTNINLLDIGCGCGAIYEFMKKLEFNNIKYIGIDYSENAIKVAKTQWKYENFLHKDYKSIDKSFLLKNSINVILCSALLNILPNADDALQHILELKSKYLIILKADIIEGDSYFNTYTMYDNRITYHYFHNKNIFLEMIKSNNYKIVMSENDNCFLLEQNNLK